MLSALQEWSGQLLGWGRGGVYREGTRDSGWQDRRLLEWELTELSQTRAGLCTISHDRNMCLLVRGWRRFMVRWEGAGKSYSTKMVGGRSPGSSTSTAD